MEALGEAGVTRALALAGTGVVRSSEYGKKVAPVVVTVVGKHGRPGSRGQAGEARADEGKVVDRIEQDLRLQTLGIVAGEVVLVLRVVVVGHGAELIGLGLADVANELFHVEVAGHEAGSQFLQKFRVDRGVGLPHVVLGIDQPATEEMLPVAVYQGMGEEGVVLLGHPVHESVPRVVVDQKLGGFRP